MRRHFRSPLARYGFTVLALLSYAGGFPQGALLAGAVAFYTWTIR